MTGLPISILFWLLTINVGALIVARCRDLESGGVTED